MTLAELRTLDDPAASEHIAAADPAIAALIERAGPYAPRPGEADAFASLARAIVFQQLATRAAAAIHGRFVAAIGGTVTARAILATAPDRLRAAGIDARLLHSAEADESLAGYLSQCTLGRQNVTLKLAMSLDGCIALADGTSRWITGPEARAHVHARRARADAILVGGETWRRDAPRLDVRLPGLEARSPRRVILTRGDAPAGCEAIASPDRIAGLADVQYLYVEGGAATAARRSPAGHRSRAGPCRAAPASDRSRERSGGSGSPACGCRPRTGPRRGRAPANSPGATACRDPQVLHSRSRRRPHGAPRPSPTARPEPRRRPRPATAVSAECRRS